MLRDEAQSEENRELFVRRVVDSKSVWFLETGAGAAFCDSNMFEETSVVMFWSDRAYAERPIPNGFEDCEPKELDLFDFVFRWLPGLAGDRVLVGPNWTGDLVGLEVEPSELQDAIVDALDEATIEAYRQRFEEESGRQ